MSDPTITTALISAAGGVLVGLLTMIGSVVSSKNDRRRLMDELQVVRGDTAAVREQTENTHDTNLRADVDLAIRGLTRIEDSQHAIRQDVARLHRDVRQMQRRITASDSEAEQVHQTIFDRLGIKPGRTTKENEQ